MARTSPEDSFRARLANYEKRAWLQPMSTGEVIDTSLRLYQRAAWLILRLTAVPMVLCLAAVVFVQEIVVPAVLTSKSPGSPAGEASDLVAALAVGIVVAGPLFCLGLSSATGTVVSVCQSLLHGSQPDPQAALAAAKRSMGSVAAALAIVLLTSLLGLIIAGGLMLIGMMLSQPDGPGGGLGAFASILAVFALVAGLVSFPIAWNSRSLVPVVAVIESQPPGKAILRSRRLMKYFPGHPMASGVNLSAGFIMLLVGVPLWLSLATVLEVTGVRGMLTHWNPVAGLGQMLGALVDGFPVYLAMWIVMPLWSVAMTVLYYDRIVRLEAYDVSVMLEDIKNADRRSVLLR